MVPKTMRVAVAVLGLAVVLVACSNKPSTPAGSSNTPTIGSTSSSTSSPTTGGTLTGKWSGTYTGTTPAGATGTVTILFRQNGSQVTGSIDIQNSPCISTGSITGLLRDTTIAFGVVKGAQRIDFAGTISGNTMSGNYSAPQCGNAEGMWTVTKTG